MDDRFHVDSSFSQKPAYKSVHLYLYEENQYPTASRCTEALLLERLSSINVKWPHDIEIWIFHSNNAFIFVNINERCIDLRFLKTLLFWFRSSC